MKDGYPVATVSDDGVRRYAPSAASISNPHPFDPERPVLTSDRHEYNPEYDPDGLSSPPLHVRPRVLRGHAVVLPVDQVLNLCGRAVIDLARLLNLTPAEALLRGMVVLETRDYGQVLSVARTLYMECHQYQRPSDRELFQMVDALSDVHSAFFAAVNYIHPHPPQVMRYVRSIGAPQADALVVEFLP